MINQQKKKKHYINVLENRQSGTRTTTKLNEKQAMSNSKEKHTQFKPDDVHPAVCARSIVLDEDSTAEDTLTHRPSLFPQSFRSAKTAELRITEASIISLCQWWKETMKD